LAFSFFNSINATGKKLSDYDLLKTHHLRYVRNEHKTEQVATQWNQIEKPEFTLLFSKVLYRLRKWNDNVTPSCSPENVNNDLFRHFSAQKQCCTDMSVLDQAVTFSSLLRGGESFFAYTELYRRQLAVFKDFEAVHLLNKHLSGHSNNVLRDACFSLLFLYFIRFGENFLFEALFCISERVSELRNLYQVRQSYIDKPVLKMCTQALVRCVASDQFFNWALDPDKMYVRDKQGNTKEAYWKALDAFYKDIYQHGVFGVKYQLEQRLPK
jgi:hypothetical protein